MTLLQNIQTLYLQGTLAYYLNSDFAVYTDLTSYVFSKNILMPFMHLINTYERAIQLKLGN